MSPPSLRQQRGRAAGQDHEQEFSGLSELSAGSKHLIRLQIFTPLSLLLAMGTNLICALVIHPGLGSISDLYRTVLTPRKELIGIYWIILYTLQVGFCVMLVAARKPETLHTITHGVGLRFAIANALMAVWAILWTARAFVAAQIVLLINLCTLLTVWLTLLRHPADKHRPLDYVFIHASMRMFLIVLLNVDLWQGGLVAFKWYKYIGSDPDHGNGKWEYGHEKHEWIVFGIVTALGLINAFVVFLARDVVWAAATIFSFIAILLGPDKPPQIVIPLIVGCGLQLIAIMSSYGLYLARKKRGGAIQLPLDAEETAAGSQGQVVD